MSYHNIKSIAAVVLCGSLGLAQTATAGVVDFESIAVGSYSSFSSGGVTFSLSSGNLTVSNDSNGVYVLAPQGTHFLDNRYGGASFIFDLAAPTNSFGLQIGATNSGQTLSAFDSGHNLLGSIDIPNQVDSSPYPYTGFYTLSYAGIAEVTLTANSGDWIVVDNVTINAVPEPETYAMMMAGLGLLGALRRRRSRG